MAYVGNLYNSCLTQMEKLYICIRGLLFIYIHLVHVPNIYLLLSGEYFDTFAMVNILTC